MSRVLLVDDDDLLAELLTEYLTSEGLEVNRMPDGESGVKEILTNNYDVVVLDSMMPKMNGLDVLKTVRAQSKIPVIMLMFLNLVNHANYWRVSMPFCAALNKKAIHPIPPTALVQVV